MNQALRTVLIVLVLTVTVATAGQLSPVRYDLLLKGGHVIDPKNGIDAVRDVAVSGSTIALVASNIPPAEAKQVIDVSGLYVTPGLIDIHMHVFYGARSEYQYGGGASAIPPDGFTFRAGVTTVVDAGGSGWRDFETFKEQVIDRSQTRILALLNIVGTGMRNNGVSEQDLNEMDAKLTAQKIKQYPDLLVGIKTAHYKGPEWDPVDRAVEAGRLADVPVMVDFGDFRPERPYQDLVLKHLRPGDISTHMYRRTVPMLDEQGRVLPYLFEARKRGVIFDVGHGGGSFVFSQAVPAMKAGWTPDSISTDLHAQSMNGGAKDMVNVMSKFLNMGMSLPDVILRSTSNPARQIKRPSLGNLTAGAEADIAVLRLRDGDFGFIDTADQRMKGRQKLECELTLKAGRVVWDLNGIASPDWNSASTKSPASK